MSDTRHHFPGQGHIDQVRNAFWRNYGNGASVMAPSLKPVAPLGLSGVVALRGRLDATIPAWVGSWAGAWLVGAAEGRRLDPPR